MATRQRRYWTGARRAPAQDRFFIEALDPGLWREGDVGDWDACWHTGMPKKDVFTQLTPGKTINHIPGNNALTVKSMLYRTLARARANAPSETMRNRWSFFPKTYAMPADYHALQAAALRDPGQTWIVKPKRESRGRGIHVIGDAGAAPLDAKWLVQRYLADPHLYDGYKYVLRCYLLIASVDPLRVYLYKDGFIKLASEPYSHDAFDNVFAHLTNPDVNQHNAAVETPVVFLSFSEYRDWLGGQGRDPDAVFSKIRDMGVLCAIAAREQMRERTRASRAWAPGCYELIGLDCMLDADLKPWLLECNLSPSLAVCASPDTGGIFEEETKRRLVADMVNLLGLNLPATDTPVLEDTAATIAAADEELSRAGRFDRIFPDTDADQFLAFFGAPRGVDVALTGAAAASAPPAITLEANGVEEVIADNELILFSEQTQRAHALEHVDAFIWLKAASGIPPNKIAVDLIGLSRENAAVGEPVPDNVLRTKVWDAVANWTALGLLRAKAETRVGVDEGTPGEAPRWRSECWIDWNGETIRLRWGAAEVAGRLHEITAPLLIEPAHANAEIDILSEIGGYALASGPTLVRTSLRLNEIAGALREHLLGGEFVSAALNCALVERRQGDAVLFAGNQPGGWDSVALGYAAVTGGDVLGGAGRLGGAPGVISALPTPARLAEDDLDTYRRTNPGVELGFSQGWPNGARGRFIPAVKHRDPAGLRICAVIAPLRQPDMRPDDAVLELVKGRAALIVLDALRNRCGQDFATEDAARLFALHETTPIYTLAYTDFTAGARAVAEALGDAISA